MALVHGALSFDQEIPHHSTFSKNRHGRFQESKLFEQLFERIVKQCVEVGMERGKELSVDGSFVEAESESNPDCDQQFNEQEQTSLSSSSLPALRFKSARTNRESGRIIVEQIIANNPDKDIVYSITIITPTDQYEKNKKLFKEIVDGFRYISTPE